MNKREIDLALSAGNPISQAALEDLTLGAAEQELVAAIVAEPQEAGERAEAAGELLGDREPLTSAWRNRAGRRYLAPLTVGAVAVAAFLVAIGTGGGPAPTPAPAFGAELVRLAKASPLVLLDAPGWHVEYAAEGSAAKGQMRFRYGDEQPAIPQHRAELRWHRGRLPRAALERQAGTALWTTTSVLHSEALLFHIGGRRGQRDVTAIWENHGRVLEFRSTVPDLATFKYRLAALRRVGTTAWLSALPPSLLKAVRRGAG